MADIEQWQDTASPHWNLRVRVSKQEILLSENPYAMDAIAADLADSCRRHLQPVQRIPGEQPLFDVESTAIEDEPTFFNALDHDGLHGADDRDDDERRELTAADEGSERICRCSDTTRRSEDDRCQWCGGIRA